MSTYRHRPLSKVQDDSQPVGSHETMYMCARDKQWLPADAFSKNQLTKWAHASKKGGNPRVVSERINLKCRMHSGEPTNQVKCYGYCSQYLPRDRFSRNQRREAERWCIDCVNWREAQIPNGVPMVFPNGDASADEVRAGIEHVMYGVDSGAPVDGALYNPQVQASQLYVDIVARDVALSGPAVSGIVSTHGVLRPAVPVSAVPGSPTPSSVVASSAMASSVMASSAMSGSVMASSAMPHHSGLIQPGFSHAASGNDDHDGADDSDDGDFGYGYGGGPVAQTTCANDDRVIQFAFEEVKHGANEKKAVGDLHGKDQAGYNDLVTSFAALTTGSSKTMVPTMSGVTQSKPDMRVDNRISKSETFLAPELREDTSGEYDPFLALDPFKGRGRRAVATPRIQITGMSSAVSIATGSDAEDGRKLAPAPSRTSMLPTGINSTAPLAPSQLASTPIGSVTENFSEHHASRNSGVEETTLNLVPPMPANNLHYGLRVRSPKNGWARPDTRKIFKAPVAHSLAWLERNQTFDDSDSADEC